MGTSYKAWCYSSRNMAGWCDYDWFFSFFDSFLFCCIKAHTRPCRARQGGVHKGTEPWHCRAGTCNTWQDIMVLNTLEVCLLAFVLLEDQGSHLPGHAGALSETEHYLAHWDFSTFTNFCLISSLAAWQNPEDDWPVAKFISHVNMKMVEPIVFHRSHPPTHPNKLAPWSE